MGLQKYVLDAGLSIKVEVLRKSTSYTVEFTGSSSVCDQFWYDPLKKDVDGLAVRGHVMNLQPDPTVKSIDGKIITGLCKLVSSDISDDLKKRTASVLARYSEKQVNDEDGFVIVTGNNKVAPNYHKSNQKRYSTTRSLGNYQKPTSSANPGKINSRKKPHTHPVKGGFQKNNGNPWRAKHGPPVKDPLRGATKDDLDDLFGPLFDP